jgi:hypothetical protein
MDWRHLAGQLKAVVGAAQAAVDDAEELLMLSLRSSR